jgi:hypothetical protein
MPKPNIPDSPEPAKRGTKRDWKVVGGEVPPELYDRLRLLAYQRATFRGTLVYEAVQSFLDREAA